MKSSEVIFDVTESADGGFEARARGNSIFTQGYNWDDLKTMARDAVHCHFKEGERPRVIRLHYLRVETIAL